MKKQRIFKEAAKKFLGRPLRDSVLVRLSPEDYINIENALRQVQNNLTLV